MGDQAAVRGPCSVSVNRLATIADVDEARIASGAASAIELGEHRALGLQRLGRVLLHVACAIERIGQACCRAHAGGGAFGVLHEAVLGKFVEPLGHQAAAPVSATPSTASYSATSQPPRAKHHGPGAADQARSDDCNAVGSHPQHFPSQFEIILQQLDAPVQVTEPRSSTTVRSDSASARSR